MSCDCGGANLTTVSCKNPCAVGAGNSAACESLPSQISNFTTQFFGAVVKSEIGGNIVWSLPCGLDAGLLTNPRAVDEGLACYFLRLFEAGIVAAQGPQGPQGASGKDGINAFTVSLQSFAQPTLASPITQVSVISNPIFVPGITVFIPNSGWYNITSVTGGVLFLSLQQPVANPWPLIPAGSMVFPAGYPGISVVGPRGFQGVPGPKGDTGAAGSSGPPGPAFPVSYGQVIGQTGTSYTLTNAYAEVVPNQPFEFLAQTAGVYLVTTLVQFVSGSGATQSSFKLYNVTLAADVANTEVIVPQGVTSPASGFPIVLSALIQTGGDNQTIALYGKLLSGAPIVSGRGSSLVWLRIS